jgi:hypothetical protein
MAYPVTFDKGKVEDWLRSVGEGGDLRCPERGWGIYDMLCLAGVCFAGVMSNGPIAYQLGKEQYEQMPAEHREAREETFENDLTAAILFCAQLALAIQDGEYDQRYEPILKALVYMQGDQRIVRALAGVK